MKNLLILVSCLLSQPAFSALPTIESTYDLPTSEADQKIDLQRRHGASIELLGRGLLYSLNYDYLFGDDIAAGGGFSTSTIDSGSGSVRAIVIPIYANYYFTPGPHRFFGTAGLNLIHASGELEANGQISGSGLAANVGLGYEFRAENGFLFRAAPYFFVGQASGLWFGLSLGYSL